MLWGAHVAWCGQCRYMCLSLLRGQIVTCTVVRSFRSVAFLLFLMKIEPCMPHLHWGNPYQPAILYPKCIHRLPLEDKKIDSKVGFPMSTGTVQINIKEATFKQYYD